jgi:hypothetical protein
MYAAPSTTVTTKRKIPITIQRSLKAHALSMTMATPAASVTIARGM